MTLPLQCNSNNYSNPIMDDSNNNIDKFIVPQESIFSVLELGSRSNPIMLNQSEYVIILSTDFVFFNMQIIGKKLYVKYYEI